MIGIIVVDCIVIYLSLYGIIQYKVIKVEAETADQFNTLKGQLKQINPDITTTDLLTMAMGNLKQTLPKMEAQIRSK